MNKPKTVFITGVTGLVGSYLLKLILADGHKVFALAREKDNKTARERVLGILSFWDKDVAAEKSHNLTVLDGDITDRNLGLDKQTINLLIDEVEEIFHSAAVTQYNWPLDKIRKVNVEGTEHILDLAVVFRDQGKLKKVNHLSTAYVCGDHSGAFNEYDLDVGQEFQTTYLQSKFEAEKVVGKFREAGLWIDIFRPSLVIGESFSGKTVTFQQSVYQLFHMLSLELFDVIPGEKLELNIEFVDELCKAMLTINSNASVRNSNYHPFRLESVPLNGIVDILSKFIGFKKPELTSNSIFLESNPTPAQKMLLQNNLLLFNENVRFDSQKTNFNLKQYGFEFSKMDKNSFLKLLEYCLEAGFIKRDHESAPN